MSKEPSNKDETLTQEQKKYLRIGCMFAWLVYLSPIAMLIALYAVCGSNAEGFGRGSFSPLVVFGLLLVIATVVVFVPDDKNKKP